MASTTGQLRALPHVGENAEPSLQNSHQSWKRLFTPHIGVKMMPSTESRGVFLPWPLLAIIVTMAIVLVSGLVTLEVQVSNLSTTLLLRDADHARQVDDLKAEMAKIVGKNAQLEVYIHDDREKLVEIKTKLGIRSN